jgi:hypothetical protein
LENPLSVVGQLSCLTVCQLRMSYMRLWSDVLYHVYGEVEMIEFIEQFDIL